MADLTGRLPVMRVSDRLTEIAELIIARAIELAWRQITAQFGVPHCGEGAERRPVSICAVGYGKLGGLELGYASDLDLVFLHDSRGERQETDGPGATGLGARPIENPLFFVRLAQRLVHLLTMHSAAGRLYEVDVRLRPSGKGGLLVTQIDAFAEYQRREAWTWEHQALLHARAVAGAPALCAEFERTRLEVLRHAVRRESLRDEVRSMRERMRRELSKGGDGRVDLKQDAGGIADIEFLAQYWALKWARDYPPVAMFSDTIRQLESVASADLVPQATVDVLTGAYRAYRTRTHHLSLAGEARSGCRGRVRRRARRGHRDMGRGDGAGRRGIIALMAAQPKSLIQPNAQNQYEVTPEDLPLSCPDAADVPVEFPPAGLSAHRGYRLGQVSLLRRRVFLSGSKSPAALS